MTPVIVNITLTPGHGFAWQNANMSGRERGGLERPATIPICVFGVKAKALCPSLYADGSAVSTPTWGWM